MLFLRSAGRPGLYTICNLSGCGECSVIEEGRTAEQVRAFFVAKATVLATDAANQLMADLDARATEWN